MVGASLSSDKVFNCWLNWVEMRLFQYHMYTRIMEKVILLLLFVYLCGRIETDWARFCKNLTQTYQYLLFSVYCVCWQTLSINRNAAFGVDDVYIRDQYWPCDILSRAKSKLLCAKFVIKMLTVTYMNASNLLLLPCNANIFIGTI